MVNVFDEPFAISKPFPVRKGDHKGNPNVLVLYIHPICVLHDCPLKADGEKFILLKNTNNENEDNEDQILTLKITMKKKQTPTTTANGIKYSCSGSCGSGSILMFDLNNNKLFSHIN